MNENELKARKEAKPYEAAKVAAIRAVQADPKVDTTLLGFAYGFLKGFEAAWAASDHDHAEGVSA